MTLTFQLIDFGVGLGEAASYLIGIQIGMNNVKTAKKYFNSIKLASFFIIFGTTLFIQ